MEHKKTSERGFEFACRLIDEFRSQKPADDAERHIWWQLFDAGYSIGANTSESHDAESGIDFIHKFLVALKEGRETLFWLRLLAYASRHDAKRVTRVRALYKDCDQIVAILVSSIKTKKRREQQKAAQRKNATTGRRTKQAKTEFWFDVPD